MKNLVLATILIILFACNKSDVKTVSIDPPKDDVLENVEMDVLSRRRPKPPHPNDTTVNPPPATAYQGCFLIDTDGETIANTLWNTSGTFTVSPSGLNATQIQYIVERVKKDFAAFSVEITTADSVYNKYPSHKRMRVVVTTSWEWYGQVGGVAYLNSFNWSDETPCFVFSSLLGYNEKYNSDAISHELGHTVGLRHKSTWVYHEDGTCTKTSEYLFGDFIMGYPYNSPAPYFGIGASSLGCYVIENEPEIITNTLKQ